MANINEEALSDSSVRESFSFEMSETPVGAMEVEGICTNGQYLAASVLDPLLSLDIEASHVFTSFPGCHPTPPHLFSFRVLWFLMIVQRTVCLHPHTHIERVHKNICGVH